MDGLERIRDLLHEEAIDLAAWAAGHESWAVVMWRAGDSGRDLFPEVYGPYPSGATAMIAGEKVRAAQLAAPLNYTFANKYGELLVQVVPMELDEVTS